jgi:hypothetical protein
MNISYQLVSSFGFPNSKLQNKKDIPTTGKKPLENLD